MAALVESGTSASAALLRRALQERHLAGPDGAAVLAAPDVDACWRALPSTLGPKRRRTLVVVDSAEIPAATAWALLQAGAEDVLCWRDHSTAKAVVERLERWAAIDSVLECPVVRCRMLGGSPALREALRHLIELSLYGTGPILLTGETGTGKELASQIVHVLTGGRPFAEDRSGQLVVVDCTTIVPSLSGSELFGHERGAFTGADRARVGAVAQADGGTLFLDEVGDLPLSLQAELLRVVQEGHYKRVGGSVWGKTSFRLVSATHRDLLKEQRRGRFRSDLYHRIASGTVQLPPLRDRLEDVEELFGHFLAGAMKVNTPPEISPVVLAMLHECSFPGNLRQLRQLATRVAARHVGRGPITAGDIPPADRPNPCKGRPKAQSGDLATLAEVVRHGLRRGTGMQGLKSLVSEVAIEVALADAGGNMRAAAEQLGVTVRALQLRRHGAKAGDALPAPG